MLLFLVTVNAVSRVLETFLLCECGQLPLRSGDVVKAEGGHSKAGLWHLSHLLGFVALANSSNSSKYFGNIKQKPNQKRFVTPIVPGSTERSERQQRGILCHLQLAVL